MKFILSFAVGAVLGDIFFHLIPESIHSHLVELNESKETAYRRAGFSILAGILVFIIVEMLLEKWSNDIDRTDNKQPPLVENKTKKKFLDQHQDEKIHIFNNNHNDLKQIVGKMLNSDLFDTKFENNNGISLNFNAFNSDKDLDRSLTEKFYNLDDCSDFSRNITFRKKLNSDCTKTSVTTNSTKTESSSSTPCNIVSNSLKTVEAAGYLNLIANGFDNFTHGLAIGASFLISSKVGLLTTFVIFVHEIPHEICDYAILVNSGFTRLDAVKAQSFVSLFGILGTAIALYVKSVKTLSASTIWILPFSAGGFLYIALVNLLPEVLDRETDLKNSIGQIACVILGIALMAAVAVI